MWAGEKENRRPDTEQRKTGLKYTQEVIVEVETHGETADSNEHNDTTGEE